MITIELISGQIVSFSTAKGLLGKHAFELAGSTSTPATLRNSAPSPALKPKNQELLNRDERHIAA